MFFEAIISLSQFEAKKIIDTFNHHPRAFGLSLKNVKQIIFQETNDCKQKSLSVNIGDGRFTDVSITEIKLWEINVTNFDKPAAA